MRNISKADQRISICSEFLAIHKATLPPSWRTMSATEKAQCQYRNLMNGVTFVGEALEECAHIASKSGGYIKVDSHQFERMGGFLIGAVEFMEAISLFIDKACPAGDCHA